MTRTLYNPSVAAQAKAEGNDNDSVHEMTDLPFETIERLRNGK